MSTDAAWRDVILALLGSWPGRLDQMTATAFVHELVARGIEPGEALRAIRESEAEHPPSAGIIMAAVTLHRHQDQARAMRAERLAALEREARPLRVLGGGQ